MWVNKMNNKKIVMIGFIDPGGIGNAYSYGVNKYTENEMRVVTFHETRGFDSDISLNRELWGGLNLCNPEILNKEFYNLIDWADIVIVNLALSPGAGNPETKFDDSSFSINNISFPEILQQKGKRVFGFFFGSTCLRSNYTFYIKICKSRGWDIITCQPDIHYNVTKRGLKCHYIPILLNDEHPRYRNSLFDFVSSNKFNPENIYISHSPTDRRIKNTDVLINTIKKVNESIGQQRVYLNLVENCGFNDSVFLKKQSYIGFDQMQQDGYYCLSSIENMALGLVNIVSLNQYAIDMITQDIGKMPPSWEIVNNENELNQCIADLYKNRNLLYGKMYNNYQFARNEWSLKNNIHKFVEAICE